jgi:LuxR family maltose regulon positive regulatory protein
VLFGRGVVELWSGRLGEAARTLEAGAAAAAAAGAEHEQADCLGHLALAQALRGQLGRAAQLATRATRAPTSAAGPAPARRPDPAALAALAWVHLERGEPREARSLLKHADAALGATPDKLTGAITCLVAAFDALAEGRAETAVQIVARARSGWPVPSWLSQRLSQAESWALAALGDIEAALAAAKRAGDDSPDAAVTLAHTWAAAGDSASARRALEPALACRDEAPQRLRLQAWLADAQISYHSGDTARGRRSLAAALRLAEHEQLRLPFVLERSWIGPVLRHDPALAAAHRRLLGQALRHDQLPARDAPEWAAAPVVEQLTERERDVLRLFAGMLNTAEVARELHISINTVKTHLKSIYRKLAATRCGEAVRRARQLELI